MKHFKESEFYNKIIFSNKEFFSAYLIFLLGGGLLYFGFKNDVILEFFNSHRIKLLNYYFIYTTELAETWGIIPILLILFFRKYSLAIIATISLILNTTLVSIIKQITNLPRPLKFYESSHSLVLNFVNGVDVHSYMSFPSGHATAGFALFLTLSLLFRKPLLKYISFFLALSVGLSRVYLLQHFFRDIYFGSILGVVVTLLLIWTFQKFNWFKVLEKKDVFWKYIKKPSESKS